MIITFAGKRRMICLCQSPMRHLSTESSESRDGPQEGENGSREEKFEKSQEEEDESIRQQILQASLQFVPQHGWTKKTLSAGAEQEGFPGVTHGMFPRGGIELISFFYKDCNEQLAKELASQVKTRDIEEENRKFSTNLFIRNAVEMRLRMITPFIEQWPQAMAVQTLPQNALQSWSSLGHLVDDIWYYAGDQSTDFNWYTKRLTLACIYKATEVCMVQDKSEDFEDTWAFLERRLEDAMKMERMRRNCSQTSSALSENLLGLWLMTRNVLGMNIRSR